MATRFLVSARAVSSPGRLLFAEFARRGQVADYRTRAGAPLALRHGRDLEALYELFVRGEYVPPAPLADRLSASAVQRIVDLGANVGMFSCWAHEQWPAAHITAVEPMPSNIGVFERWVKDVDEIELLPVAGSTAAGTASFIDLGGGSMAIAAPADDAIAVQVVDIFPFLVEADLVKMDIEGGEWEILADPRLGDVRATFVIEYHRVNAPYLPARDAAVELFEAAGFVTGFGESNYWGHGTLWAWRPDASNR